MTIVLKWIGRLVTFVILLALTGYAGVCGYLYAKQRDMLYITPHTQVRLPVEAVPGIQDVRLKTPDGETLQAWYLPPRDGKPIFLFFGGQGSSLEVQMGRYTRMAAMGDGFLALAYRGFSQSTGHPSEDGLFMDGLVAYDWLKAQGYGRERIVLHGHSLGSGVATYVATQRPARGLILEAPFTAASDVGQERYPYIPVQFLMQDKFASRDRIGAVYMPVLIVHGDRDSVVPFAHGQRLFARANQPKTFIRMAGEDHSTLTRAGIYDRYQAWVEGLPAPR
ncbi:MAG: alpha/beta hydrolase [Asticcacaulis sp.]